MTWGFTWRLWTNFPPTPQPGDKRGRSQMHKCSGVPKSNDPEVACFSKSKRNVYYHWKWKSPLKNCTLWLEASSEDSEPTVALSTPLPPPPPHTHTHTHNRETREEVRNVQMPSSSLGRPPGRQLVSALSTPSRDATEIRNTQDTRPVLSPVSLRGSSYFLW